MTNLPRIIANVIPHLRQRFSTVGDYFEYTDLIGPLGERNPGWWFNISEMGNPDYEFLVLIHELIEWYLAQKRGISEPDILAFDTMYEAKRDPSDLTSEPGHDPSAPYHHEHVFAECVERLVAQELGVNWQAYEAAVNALP